MVIPARLWQDIEIDGMSYSIARCVNIINHTHGVFQRYGNLHGNLGFRRVVSPGYIDRKDGKYFYTRNPRKGSLPYTNNLSTIRFTTCQIVDQPILLSDISIVFGSLKADSTIPMQVLDAAAKPLTDNNSLITSINTQQNKKQ